MNNVTLQIDQAFCNANLLQCERASVAFAAGYRAAISAGHIAPADLAAKEEVLRVIDSCGGAPDPLAPEWSQGYNDALDSAEKEIKRLFGRKAEEALMLPPSSRPIGRPLVIIESPYAGNIEANVEYARACVRDSLMRGEAPIASHLLYTQPGILRDEVAEERRQGIDSGMEWRRAAEKAVFYIDNSWSGGMLEARRIYQLEGFPHETRSIEHGSAAKAAELKAALIKAKAHVDAMTAEEYSAMIQAQKESWARSCAPAQEPTND